MALADYRERSIRCVLADPHLPQRTIATQWNRHHLIDEVVERARRPVHVPIDRERGIVDPLGRVQAQWDGRELLAVARRATEARLDVIAQLLETRQPTLVGRRECRDPAYVHVRAWRLHSEERRIERRKPHARHFASTNRGRSSGVRTTRVNDGVRRPVALARDIRRWPHSAATANWISRSK